MRTAISKAGKPRYYFDNEDKLLLFTWCFQHGYTVQKMCSELKISSTNLSNILSGRIAIGLTLLCKLCEFTQIDFYERSTGEKLLINGQALVQ